MKKMLFLIFWMVWLISLQLFGQGLPTQESTLFSGSGNCVMCHEPGPPNNQALRTPAGEDVSPITQWRSTMMANAARDPFWQAKVTAEISANPHLQSVIEDKCTTCHAPMGRTEAVWHDSTYQYTLAEMQQDTLAMDGVSCTACHQIQDVNMGQGSSFSGGYVIDNIRQIYGPYDNMLIQPMATWVNYVPVYSPHVKTSEICATCHTLFTPTVDNQGNIIGEQPEQTPYLEWRNSVYPAANTECQTCHMPALQTPITISNRPTGLPSYAPYPQHYFVGANVFMLKMFKNHSSEIGVTATPEQMDSTIARTERMLQEQSADLSAQAGWRSADTLEIKATLKNNAGHKLPTAYPSRRVWLYVSVQDANGQTLFRSGAWDAQGEILHLDAPYEPHHDIITDSTEVQVYETVMHDVDSSVTYTLLRLAGYLKDNRIPPEGFLRTGPFYDSTRIAGAALNDPNFNRSGAVEGTGADTVTYRIGVSGISQADRVEIKLLYQTIKPAYAQDIFQYNTPEILRFQNFYNQADKRPFTMDSLLLTVSPNGIGDGEDFTPASPLLVKAYPNPFNPTLTVEITVPSAGDLSGALYNVLGEKVADLFSGPAAPGVMRFNWEASKARSAMSSGVYMLTVEHRSAVDQQKFRAIEKVVYLR